MKGVDFILFFLILIFIFLFFAASGSSHVKEPDSRVGWKSSAYLCSSVLEIESISMRE